MASENESEDKIPTQFPLKLMLMINWCQQQVESEFMEKKPIEWIPSGEGFSINDPQCLIKRVLPIFFKSTHYQSFIRKFYRWIFKRTQSDLGIVIYSAKNFHRDMPHLAEKLNIKYSQKENEFQQACAMKKRGLRLNQNKATDKNR